MSEDWPTQHELLAAECNETISRGHDDTRYYWMGNSQATYRGPCAKCQVNKPCRSTVIAPVKGQTHQRQLCQPCLYELLNGTYEYIP